MELKELRKTADAATPGPWEVWKNVHCDPVVVPAGKPWAGITDPKMPFEKVAGLSTAPDDYGRANLEYIATFDPPTVLALLNRLEQAEQKVASLEAKMDGENLRWVAWEMVENSGHLDLPIVTWINRISDDEVSLDAAKYFFFGGTSPCIHLGSYEPFDIGDEDRPACKHCNRRALDGDGRG